MNELDESTRANLQRVIRKVRGRVQKARERRESLGEENTKITLIEPILKALGWDIYEIDEVRREYKRKPTDNPVDYALFVMRSPRLFIEAKDLSKDLSGRKSVSQTLGYATVVGVEWCVLTNGDEYRLYNAHAPVDVEKKLFRSFSISDALQHDLAVETFSLLAKDSIGEPLRSLWKAHFVDRKVQTSLQGLFSEPDRALIRLVRRGIPDLKPSEVRESLKRAEIKVDFPAILSPQVSPKTQTASLQRQRRDRPHKRGDIDTIVVPAREEGFQTVFLGENRWYAIRMRERMIPNIRFIAAYQVAPVSAITHVAEVESIKPWPGTSKYVVKFAGPARKIGPIAKGKASPPQSPRYASASKLEKARTLADVF